MLLVGKDTLSSCTFQTVYILRENEIYYLKVVWFREMSEISGEIGETLNNLNHQRIDQFVQISKSFWTLREFTRIFGICKFIYQAIYRSPYFHSIILYIYIYIYIYKGTKYILVMKHVHSITVCCCISLICGFSHVSVHDTFCIHLSECPHTQLAYICLGEDIHILNIFV